MSPNFLSAKQLLKRQNKQMKYLIPSMMVLILVVGVIAYQTFKNQLEALFNTESYVYLDEVSDQNIDTIHLKIKGDIDMLHGIAMMLGEMEEIDMDDWIEALQDKNLFLKFEKVAVILPNGKGYTNGFKELDLASQAYFQRAMNGKEAISEVEMGKTAAIKTMTYAVPVYKEGKVIAVLSAVTNLNKYENAIKLSIFNGKGHFYIMNREGDIIVHSNDINRSIKSNNLFKEHLLSKDNKEKILNDIQAAEEGKVVYRDAGVKYQLMYEKIGIDGWYLLTSVVDDVTASKTKKIETLTLLLSILFTVMMVSFFGYIVIKQHKHKKRLMQLAYIDELTGSKNKNSFKQEVELLIKREKSQYAFIMLDIDKFKIINDIFGYAKGDKLLKHMADVLSQHMGPNELFARIESDEFYILMEFTTKEALQQRVENILEDMTSFKFSSDSHYRLVVCVGIYVIDDIDISIDSISDRANLANARTKGSHKSSYFYYNENIRNQLIDEKEIENDLQSALDDNEFTVFLQPKYDLKTEKIVGAEALIRWQHPKKGFIPPYRFIPLCEKNGFVTKIDMFVLEEICKNQKALIEQGNTPLLISINQSRLHLYNAQYVNELLSIVRKYDMDPGLIELELTESVVFDDMKVFTDVTRRLHDEGFKLSVDDFGTGYSSLNMLKDIVVDTLKLDREFFTETDNLTRSHQITKNIINMSKDLGMKIVAEGVETAQQVEFLRDINCDIAQGYYYAKPMPLADFYELLLVEYGKD